MNAEEEHSDSKHKKSTQQHTEQTIPVIEEQVHLDKKTFENVVKIKKVIHEEEVPVETQLIDEHITVERREKNQILETAPPAIRYEDNVTIVPVLREEVVVQKRLILVEELHITKHRTTSDFSGNETVRKEEVIVKTDNDGASNKHQG